jgi:hypothetical protein
VIAFTFVGNRDRSFSLSSELYPILPSIGARGHGVMIGASHMDKLQQLLDTAFGQPDTVREPQAPSEYFIERQREFEKRAEKIAALRKARLDRSAGMQ